MRVTSQSSLREVPLRTELKQALKRRYPWLVRVRDALGRPTSAASPEPVEVAPSAPEEALDDVISVFTRAEVEELIEDMIRPALASDGGDIYVRLLGSCVGCPSSKRTLTDGVERLFLEELPGFENLIDVADA